MNETRSGGQCGLKSMWFVGRIISYQKTSAFFWLHLCQVGAHVHELCVCWPSCGQAQSLSVHPVARPWACQFTLWPETESISSCCGQASLSVHPVARPSLSVYPVARPSLSVHHTVVVPFMFIDSGPLGDLSGLWLLVCDCPHSQAEFCMLVWGPSWKGHMQCMYGWDWWY